MSLIPAVSGLTAFSQADGPYPLGSGFFIPIEPGYVDAMYEEQAKSYFQASKNLGGDSVIVQPRLEFADGAIGPIVPGEVLSNAYDVFVNAAKSNDLSLFSGFAVSPSQERMDRLTQVRFLEKYAEESVKFAKRAESDNAFAFSPFAELELVIDDPMLINEFVNDTLGRWRANYSGLLIPRFTYEQKPEAVNQLRLSGFDKLGLDAWPADSRNVSEFARNYSDMLDRFNLFSSSQGLGKAVVTETGVPVGGNLGGTASDPRFRDIPNNVTEEVQMDAVKEILAGSKGRVDGLYFFGFGSGIDPWAVDGRPAGEVIRRYFGGAGPNDHPDYAPHVSGVDLAMFRHDEAGKVQYGNGFGLFVSDVSGNEDLDDSKIELIDPRGEVQPGSFMQREVSGDLFNSRLYKFSTKDDKTYGDSITRFGDGWVARLSDKNGNTREELAIPKEWAQFEGPDVGDLPFGRTVRRFDYSGQDTAIPIKIPQTDGAWDRAFEDATFDFAILDGDRKIWEASKTGNGFSDVKLSEGQSFGQIEPGKIYTFEIWYNESQERPREARWENGMPIRSFSGGRTTRHVKFDD